KEKGKVLTLTSGEALKIGIANGEVRDVQELFVSEGIVTPRIIVHTITFTDGVMSFLMSPAVQGFLIVLIMAGIYFEMSSPGIGLPLFVAVIAIALYFAPLYLEGLAAHWEILLFIAGIILLLL